MDLDPKITAKLQPFAVVRNPWARTASRFMMHCRECERFGQPVKGGMEGFRRFLETRHADSEIAFPHLRAIRGWCSQMDWVCNAEGRLVCACLRQEYLSDDLESLLAKPFALGEANRSSTNRYDWRNLYDRETEQIVADWYSRDIDFFGFGFDSPAVRNVMGK